ncbi:MAG: Asp23/Gls24 family envelope stress response protein [Lentisphaeria bacterium]|nr:Asp23/Gls24 family envelope stress response protein [Lentisphaeria bacterium]
MKEIKEEKKSAAEMTASAGTVLEVTGMGEVKIHENVISSLVRKAVLSVDGVSRLSGSQLVDIIAETVGSRRMQDRAIAVIVDEAGRTSIDIKLNLKFGFKIPEVSIAVQKAVISEVENTTGMTVAKVNVIVQELETEEELESAVDSTMADTVLPLQH